jgi:hypothetical protein
MMKTATMQKMGQKQRRERAAALRTAAEQIESCWTRDSLGAATAFMFDDPSVADHLGSLNPPRWMTPLVYGDPQQCVVRLLHEADTYEE